MKTFVVICNPNGEPVDLLPTTPDPQAKVANTDDNWNEAFTIPAKCFRAEAVFDKAAFAMPGVSGTDPDQDGAPYLPNIRVPITGIGGKTNDTLFVKNRTAGQDVTTELTFYCTE